MRLLLLLLIIFSSIPLTSAVSIETLAATSIDTDSAILNGNVTNISSSAVVRFQYGIVSGTYIYITDNQTITTNGTFTATVRGFPTIAGHTVYFRAVATEGSTTVYGSELSYTLSAVTQITEYTFDTNYQELKDANFNITNLATAAPKAYTDIMGTIFYGFLFGIPFIVMWIRQEDVTLPAIVGIILSGTIFSYLPETWLKVGYALFIVSIAGLVYQFYKSRR